jgi:hypothetical protein
MNEAQDDSEARTTRVRARPTVWEVIIAEDDTEIDLEELAAFAEGRLPPTQHQRVGQSIARSPRAIDILDALLEFLAEEQETGPTRTETIRRFD